MGCSGNICMYVGCSGHNRVCMQVAVGESHMYMGCSGHNRVCTWVVVRLIAYIRIRFLGRSRSVHADISNSTCDVNKLYRWSATDLWAEKISRDLLRFGFLIFIIIGQRTRLSSDFGEICIG
jgi:hypothetical protein